MSTTTPKGDRSSKKAQTLLARYGICAVCEAPVQYPGLDGYKCGVCGWIKVSEIALLLKKREEAKQRAVNVDSS